MCVLSAFVFAGRLAGSNRRLSRAPVLLSPGDRNRKVSASIRLLSNPHLSVPFVRTGTICSVVSSSSVSKHDRKLNHPAYEKRKRKARVQPIIPTDSWFDLLCAFCFLACTTLETIHFRRLAVGWENDPTPMFSCEFQYFIRCQH